MQGLRINGNMRNINYALHEQCKIHGGNMKVSDWRKVLVIFPQVSRKFLADYTGGE